MTRILAVTPRYLAFGIYIFGIVKSLTCPDISFYENHKCADESGCYSGPKKCDGNWDCLDGSDEAEAVCKNHTCSHEYTKCRDGKQCIFEGFMCSMQGWTDCKDESDGDVEYCRNRQCNDRYEKCKDGIQCIPTNYRCNGGRLDCNDGSDEENCEEYTCPQGYSKCRDGKQCIPTHFFCVYDGLVFCEDGSDEDPAYCGKRKRMERLRSLLKLT